MNSKRFPDSVWTRWLMPVLLTVLLLGLVAVFVIVGLSAAGFKFGR
jgi:hypothetical protein